MDEDSIFVECTVRGGIVVCVPQTPEQGLLRHERLAKIRFGIVGI